MPALQTTKQVGGTFVMLKKLIPNSDIVIEKCID